MDKMTKEERIEKAYNLFKSGFNCSQSVAAAFADELGLTEEQALKVSASFGAGIGRMRETCGAACGMFILAGLKYGATEATDREKKGENYKIVQELAEKFKEKNGFLKCRDLLGLTPNLKEGTQPSERNSEYYAKRPCAEIIRNAAEIWANYTDGEKDGK